MSKLACSLTSPSAFLAYSFLFSIVSLLKINAFHLSMEHVLAVYVVSDLCLHWGHRLNVILLGDNHRAACFYDTINSSDMAGVSVEPARDQGDPS